VLKTVGTKHLNIANAIYNLLYLLINLILYKILVTSTCTVSFIHYQPIYMENHSKLTFITRLFKKKFIFELINAFLTLKNKIFFFFNKYFNIYLF
jgi:hypothetical protein